MVYSTISIGNSIALIFIYSPGDFSSLNPLETHTCFSRCYNLRISSTWSLFSPQRNPIIIDIQTGIPLVSIPYKWTES